MNTYMINRKELPDAALSERWELHFLKQVADDEDCILFIGKTRVRWNRLYVEVDVYGDKTFCYPTQFVKKILRYSVTHPGDITSWGEEAMEEEETLVEEYIFTPGQQAPIEEQTPVIYNKDEGLHFCR